MENTNNPQETPEEIADRLRAEEARLKAQQRSLEKHGPAPEFTLPEDEADEDAKTGETPVPEELLDSSAIQKALIHKTAEIRIFGTEPTLDPNTLKMKDEQRLAFEARKQRKDAESNDANLDTKIRLQALYEYKIIATLLHRGTVNHTVMKARCYSPDFDEDVFEKAFDEIDSCVEGLKPI